MATAIRQYLKDQGYGDKDIDYSNGNVTLRGKNFFAATPQAYDDPSQGLMKDNTYGDPTALSSALNTYRTTERGNNLNTTQNNLYNNVNNTPFQFKAPAAFSFDQNTDPQYQSALQGALRNAQTAQSNALVGLGSRGIANSSVAVDRSNQIQQRAVGDVQTNMLPQLIQQAFQRYQDSANRDYQTQAANYGSQQDQIKNQSALSSYLNGLQQQDVDNTYRDNVFGETKKQNNLDAANAVGQQLGRVIAPKDDYSNLYNQTDAPLNLQGQQMEYQKARDQIGDVQYKQKFDEDVRQFGLQYALQAASQANALSNNAADNRRADSADQRAATSAEQSQLMDIWQATGVAPEGIPGVKAGTPMAGKQATPEKPKTAEDYYNNFDDSRFVNKPSKDMAGRATPQSVTDPEGLEIAILSLDLPENELRKLYNRYGLKWGE